MATDQMMSSTTPVKTSPSDSSLIWPKKDLWNRGNHYVKAPGNGPIVPDTLLYYNLYDQLWKQRQKQEDFEKRLDTSEKEKEEFRTTFQAELSDLEKQLKGQTSAFMKKLRQSEERLEARLDAVQRQLDTQKATQNANAETMQHDIRNLQRTLDLRPDQDTAPAPAPELPMVRDLKRPITTTDDIVAVKRRKEGDLSPVLDLDTRGHLQSSSPKLTQTRSKTKPKPSVSGKNREKASKTRTEEFRQKVKDAHDAYLRLKPPSFSAVRGFVYKFIESISDFEISQKLQKALLADMSDYFREAKRCVNGCRYVVTEAKNLAWEDVCRVANSIDVGEE